jgi:pilus assembly protein CpaB
METLKKRRPAEVNQRPAAAAKRRSKGDSLKQFVSTRRGAYAIAAIAASLAGLVLLFFIGQYKEDVNAGLAPAAVLTADRLIPRGTAAGEVITQKLFKASAIPQTEVRPGAVTQASQIVGKVAVRDVLPGQQITVADFAATADPIRSRLTKRERAVQIPIDAIHGLLSTIRAGDHVDILAAFNGATEKGTGTPTLEPLVRDIRIMQNTGASVILETTDTEGAKLAFAADNAKLWFLLRPPIGAKDSKASTVSQDTLKPFEVDVTSKETADGGTVTITGKQGEK